MRENSTYKTEIETLLLCSIEFTQFSLSTYTDGRLHSEHVRGLLPPNINKLIPRELHKNRTGLIEWKHLKSSYTFTQPAVHSVQLGFLIHSCRHRCFLVCWTFPKGNVPCEAMHAEVLTNFCSKSANRPCIDVEGGGD